MPASVAVVIPCYRVKNHILDVVSRIGAEVNRVFVIDDACPEGSGQLVQAQCADPRVTVLYLAVNQGWSGGDDGVHRSAKRRSRYHCDR